MLLILWLLHCDGIFGRHKSALLPGRLPCRVAGCRRMSLKVLSPTRNWLRGWPASYISFLFCPLPTGSPFALLFSAKSEHSWLGRFLTRRAGGETSASVCLSQTTLCNSLNPKNRMGTTNRSTSARLYDHPLLSEGACGRTRRVPTHTLLLHTRKPYTLETSSHAWFLASLPRGG
jgi:hypothetical protein